MHILDDIEDLDAANIYIEPPDPNVLTDEDSGDEDGGLVDNLCGRQLRARAEIEFTDGNRVGGNSVSDEATPCFPLESHTFTFPTVEQSKWVKGNLEFNGNFQEPNYSAYFGLSPTNRKWNEKKMCRGIL